jgi:hypothetical protein
VDALSLLSININGDEKLEKKENLAKEKQTPRLGLLTHGRRPWVTTFFFFLLIFYL